MGPLLNSSQNIPVSIAQSILGAIPCLHAGESQQGWDQEPLPGVNLKSMLVLGAAKHRACSGLHPSMVPLASLLGRIEPQTSTVSLAIPKSDVPPCDTMLSHSLFPEGAGEAESYSCFLPRWL